MLKFGIKGTIIESYFFNNRISFNIVVAVKKLQVKDFYL